MSKKTALNILASLLTEVNLETMRRISNEYKFSNKVKDNFNQLKELMYRYK
jgi:adenine C2-methylase RlmN of 23S rRNA A2503 and tRNA A37